MDWWEPHASSILEVQMIPLRKQHKLRISSLTYTNVKINLTYSLTYINVKIRPGWNERGPFLYCCLKYRTHGVVHSLSITGNNTHPQPYLPSMEKVTDTHKGCCKEKASRANGAPSSCQEVLVSITVNSTILVRKGRPKTFHKIISEEFIQTSQQKQEKTTSLRQKWDALLSVLEGAQLNNMHTKQAVERSFWN